MGQKEELDQRLWEFVYDLLSEQEMENVRARITSEPDVARAYSRVKLESQIVAAAARHEADPVALQVPADVGDEALRVELPRPLAITRSPLNRSANWLVGLAATALVCLMGYGYLYDASRRVMHDSPPALRYVCTQLSTPDRIREQVTNPFFVRTTDVSGAPLAARLAYRFCDSDGDVKLAGNTVTDAKGRSQIDLPGALAKEVDRLELESADRWFSPEIRADLTRSEVPLVTHLAMGKPQYQAGETAQFRSVTLSTVGLKSDEQVVVAYDVWDVNGRPVVPNLPQKRTDRGVGAGSFVVPPDLPSGTYFTVAYSPQAKFAAVSQRFDVPLGMALRTSWNVESSPALDVSFFPEGGQLVAGLANRVYFQTKNSAGAPVEITGQILDTAGKPLARVKTEQRGRGVFEHRSELGQTYQLAIEEPADVAAQPQLPATTEDPPVTMRVPEPVLAADAPIQVELLASRRQSDHLAVAAYCRNAMVGQQAIDAADFAPRGSSWSGQITVPIAREASGVLRVALFDYEHDPPKPIAERLVFRRTRHQLTLQVENLAESYVPGSEVKLRLQATNETGEPNSAVLGIGILETASLPAGADFNTRLPTYFYLASELNPPQGIEPFETFLGKGPNSDRDLDLLLGTSGLREPRHSRLAALVQSGAAGRVGMSGGMGGGGFAARGALSDEVLALGVTPETSDFARSRWGFHDLDSGAFAPLLYDNSAEVRRAASMPSRSPPATSGVDLAALGRVLVFGAAALLVVALLVNLLRLSSGVRVWAPVVTAACASLLVGLIWMQESPSDLGAVASTAFEAEADRDEQVPLEAGGIRGTQSFAMPDVELPEVELPEVELAEEDLVEKRLIAPAEDAAASRGLERGEEALAGSTASPVDKQLGQEMVGDGPKPPARSNESPGSMPEAEERLSLQDAPAMVPPAKPQVERFSRARKMGVAAEDPASRRAFSEGAIPRQTADRLMRSAGQPVTEVPASGKSALPAPRRVTPIAPTAPTAPAAPAAPEPEMAVGEGVSAVVKEKKLEKRDAVPPADKQPLSYGAARGKGVVTDLFYQSPAAGSRRAETMVYWNPLLVTDENGRATIEFKIPDRETQLLLFVDAHADGRLGALETTIVSRAPSDSKD